MICKKAACSQAAFCCEGGATMKKHFGMLLLTVLLLLALTVTVLAADVSYAEAVRTIGEQATEESPESGLYYKIIPLEEDRSYVILRHEDLTEVGIDFGDCAVFLPLPAEFPACYACYAMEGQTRIGFEIDPRSYTPETELTASAVEGDAETAAALLELAQQSFPELIRQTGAVFENWDLVPALGFTAFPVPCEHEYDEGILTLPPTCVDQGVMTYTCRLCGATFAEPVPATGIHTWNNGETILEPSCTASGKKIFTCTVCGAKEERSAAALGHAWRVEKITSEVETETDDHGKANFVCSRCGKKKSGKRCASEIFLDMPQEGNWAHKPIEWGYFSEITSGKTLNTFVPKSVCTRAEVMTFLWAAAGKPMPRGTTNPFLDVKKSAYYYNAVLWAVENGITAGKTETSFAPKAPCNRAEVITFLWVYNNKPAGNGGENPFRDVRKDAYYYRSVMWAVSNGITGGVTSTEFAPKKPCTRAQIMAFLYKNSRSASDQAIWTQSFPLWDGDTAISGRLFCRGNRGYVDYEQMRARYGSPNGTPSRPVVTKQGRQYLALDDAVAMFKLAAEFRKEDSSVHLYRISRVSWTIRAANGSEKAAYIRLEDLMADYGLNNRFTHEQLLRIRFFGDYLGANSDGFYLAWIPCYVNPGEQVVNNIAERFNFYNADFVFTLDALIRDGGRIGLHGYTHQDHDSVSADGYEFGSGNNLTEAEMLERFRKAEDTATKLGYRWYFFEFPHYASTAFQRSVAEKHFDVIYQQYPNAQVMYQIETRVIGNHRCRWVPTPGEYVNGHDDRDRFCALLETCKNKGRLMSFFFHPYVDTRFFNVTKSGNTMQCSFDENGSNVLPEVLRLFRIWGYRLKTF